MHYNSTTNVQKCNRIQSNHYNSSDALEALKEHMQAHGWPCNGTIIADGHIHRYSADAQPNKLDEWYWALNEAYFFVAKYGSWTTSDDEWITFYYPNKINEHPSFAGYVKRIETEHAREYKVLVAGTQNKARHLAEYILDHAEVAPPSALHYAYLTHKGINHSALKGIKYNTYKTRPQMIIPMYDIPHHELQTVQIIGGNNTDGFYKKFLPGSRKKGCCHVINAETITDGDTLYCGEGYATCVSLYNAVNNKNTHVLFCGDAGNLESVVGELRNKFPRSKIIIGGDGDERGREAAHAAAGKFGCAVVFPAITSGQLCKSFKDFNDVEQKYGTQRVKEDLGLVARADRFKELKNSACMNAKANPCADFAFNKIPPVLKNLVDGICASSSASPIIVLSSLVATASALIGKRYFIPKGEFFNELYCNVWIICVGSSGQYKTTALNAGTRLAADIKRSIIDRINELKTEIDTCEDQKEKKKLIAEFSKKERELLQHDVLFPSSFTCEKLLEILGNNRSGVIVSNEIGGFIKKIVDDEMVPDFTQFYDVAIPPYTRETKTQGNNYICDPYISIMGVSTIDWINMSIKDSDTFGGFYPRFLFYVLPESDEKPASLPRFIKNKITTVNTAAYDIYKNILLNVEEKRIYKLSEDAVDLYDQLFNVIYDYKKTFDESLRNKLDLYSNRWGAYVLKIALIMQVFLDPDKKEITPAAIEAAFYYVHPAIKSTIHLYEGKLGETEFETNCRELYEFICRTVARTGKSVTKQEIYSSKCIKGIKSKDYCEMIERLVISGKIKETKVPSKKGESSGADFYEPLT